MYVTVIKFYELTTDQTTADRIKSPGRPGPSIGMTMSDFYGAYSHTFHFAMYTALSIMVKWRTHPPAQTDVPQKLRLLVFSLYIATDFCMERQFHFSIFASLVFYGQ